MDLPVECMDCKKRFQFEESLVVHQSVCKKHHESKSRRPYSCEQCGKSFKSMTSLRNHARTHTDYFDITKDLFDHTMRSGWDSSMNILESTRSSDADMSAINRSLDISAVMFTDSATHVTYTCNTKTANTTNDVNSTFNADKTLTDIIVESSAAATFSVDTNSCDNQKVTDMTETIDINKNDDKSRKDIPVTPKQATTFTLDSQSNKTYVCDQKARDAGVDSEGVVSLDKTYVWEGGKRLSTDRTYLVQSPNQDKTIVESGNAPMNTTHVISHHVTNDEISEHKRRSGIPVSIHSKIRIPKTTSSLTDANRQRSHPSPSIKSIRTLRGSRSRSRTPNKGDKKKLTPNEATRSKSRSRTPVRTKRTSRYAVRITSYNVSDLMRADSPFRLTPLSPMVNQNNKKKPTTDSTSIKCPKCGKVFLDQDQYDIHYVIHARDTPVKCGIPADCFKKNNRKLQFGTPDKSISTTHKPSQSHVCPHCQRAYQSERFLQTHMKIHFIDVPFACSQCDKRFKYQQSLRAHAIIHVGEESKGKMSIQSSKSAECNKRNSIQLQDVLGDIKLPDNVLGNMDDDVDFRAMLDSPFTCSLCPYKTSNPTDLLKHMQTHSRPRPFKCSECDKSYKTRSNLELHKKVHMIGKIKTLLKENRNSVGPKVLSQNVVRS